MDVDYDKICYAARMRARGLPSSVDWRDLAQQSALRQLMGRKSVDGPMQDLLRKQLVGNTRSRVTQIVELDPALQASDKDPAGVLIRNQTIRRLIHDPILTAQERSLLKAILKDNATVEILAKRRHVVPSRISQILTSIKTKLREDRRSNLHDLYIKQGLSTSKIAKLFTVSPKRVRLSLKEFGIEIRPAGTPLSTHCAECQKPIHKRYRCKFHYKLWQHKRSVSKWAGRSAKLGPITPQHRSEWAKRVWASRRKRHGARGGNLVGWLTREQASARAKKGHDGGRIRHWFTVSAFILCSKSLMRLRTSPHAKVESSTCTWTQLG